MLPELPELRDVALPKECRLSRGVDGGKRSFVSSSLTLRSAPVKECFCIHSFTTKILVLI